MDEVDFEVTSHHEPPVGWWPALEIRVNGTSLLELVHSLLPRSGPYMGIDPAQALARRLSGRPVMRDLDGRLLPARPLLRCTCGESGCDSVRADILVDDDVVTWRHFEAAGVALDLGPFRFDRRQYDDAVRRAAQPPEA